MTQKVLDVNDGMRIMVLRVIVGMSVLNLLSAYAPVSQEGVGRKRKTSST